MEGGDKDRRLEFCETILGKNKRLCNNLIKYIIVFNTLMSNCHFPFPEK